MHIYQEHYNFTDNLMSMLLSQQKISSLEEADVNEESLHVNSYSLFVDIYDSDFFYDLSNAANEFGKLPPHLYDLLSDIVVRLGKFKTDSPQKIMPNHVNLTSQ